MKPPDYLLRVIFMLLAAALPVVILLHYRDSTVVSSFDGPRFAAWVSCLLGMIGLLVLAGLKIRGRVLGALIDERNRYSLSRLQMTLWTALVLATVYAVYMANIVRGDAIGALEVDLDFNLIALMGLSFASFVAAPMALSRKAAQPGDDSELAKTGQQLRDTQDLDAMPSAAGRVLVKSSPEDARLADLIRGEDITNASVVDVPRLQMLVVTTVVVLAYGAAVGHCLGAGSWLLTTLPKLHQTLLMLMLISHGGYVAGKLIPSSSAGSGMTPQHTARALQASQRAASLAADLQAQLSACAPGDPRYGWLLSSLAIVQGAAADAAALPGRFGVTDFKPDEISNVEGRIDALQASLRAQPAGPAARLVLDAPSAEMVGKVQRRLYALGHNNVAVTGIADASTDKAIRDELAKLGVDRTDLHPRQYRFFEEFAQLIN